MRPLRTLTLVAGVVLVGATSMPANPLPDPPRPLPLRSLGELQSVLEGPTSPEFADALWQATALGPEYTWLLAELAQRDDLTLLLNSVFSGLAENGDPESLAVLRGVLMDTARPAFVRGYAASALAYARDGDAVPLLEELASQPQQEDLAAQVKHAIRRLETPGRYRKLFELRGDFVRFGFLLDDIESIEYSQYHPAAELSFEAGEFRELCDLLQTGSNVTVGMLEEHGTLVFRLKDGTEATLHTDGTVFSGVGGGMLSAPSLGAFIRQHLEPDRSGGEPPN